MPTKQEQPEPLNLRRLAQTLAASTVGHTIDYHRSVASTMPLAHALAERPDTRAGTLVVAEEQTAGRGRRARAWHAPPATSLLVSVILKPLLLAPTPAAVAQMPMLAALSVVDAVSAVVPEADVALKWPNDVLIRLPDKEHGKLAGILVETTYRRDTPVASVLGIGINVHQRAHQLPPVHPNAPPPASLYTALNRTIDRTALLVELCRALAASLSETLPSPSLFHRWRDLLLTLDRRVTLYPTGLESASAVTGIALDVEPDGALVLRDDAGTRHTFRAGDATLRAG